MAADVAVNVAVTSALLTDGTGSTHTGTGLDMFETLVRLCRELESDGLMIAVQRRGGT